MNTLKGYRTFIANGVAVVAAVGLFFGVVIPEDERTAIVAGLIAIGNIALRFATSTRAGSGV